MEKTKWKSDKSIGRIVGDIAISTGIGAGLGHIAGKLPTPKIKKINNSQWDFESLSKRVLTNFKRGNWSNMSWKTFKKLLSFELLDGSVSTTLEALINEFKDEFGNLSMDNIKKILNNLNVTDNVDSCIQ